MDVIHTQAVGHSSASLAHKSAWQALHVTKLALMTSFVSFPILVWYNVMLLEYWDSVEAQGLTMVTGNSTASVPMSLETIPTWYSNTWTLHISFIVWLMFLGGLMVFAWAPWVLASGCTRLPLRTVGAFALFGPAAAILAWLTLVVWAVGVGRLPTRADQRTFLEAAAFAKPAMYVLGGGPLMWAFLARLKRELPPGLFAPLVPALVSATVTVMRLTTGPTLLYTSFIAGGEWNRILIRLVSFPLENELGLQCIRMALRFGGGHALPPHSAALITLPFRLASAFVGRLVVGNLPTFTDTVFFALAVSVAEMGMRWTQGWRDAQLDAGMDWVSGALQNLCRRQGRDPAPSAEGRRKQGVWGTHFHHSSVMLDGLAEVLGVAMAVPLTMLFRLPPIPGSPPLSSVDVLWRGAVQLGFETGTQAGPLLLLLALRWGVGWTPPPLPAQDLVPPPAPTPASASPRPKEPERREGTPLGGSMEYVQSGSGSMELPPHPAFQVRSGGSSGGMGPSLASGGSSGGTTRLISIHPPLGTSGSLGTMSGRSTATDGSEEGEGVEWGHGFAHLGPTEHLAQGGGMAPIRVGEAGRGHLSPVTLGSGGAIMLPSPHSQHSLHSLYTIREVDNESARSGTLTVAGGATARYSIGSTATRVVSIPMHLRQGTGRAPPSSSRSMGDSKASARSTVVRVGGEGGGPPTMAQLATGSLGSGGLGSGGMGSEGIGSGGYGSGEYKGLPPRPPKGKSRRRGGRGGKGKRSLSPHLSLSASPRSTPTPADPTLTPDLPPPDLVPGCPGPAAALPPHCCNCCSYCVFCRRSLALAWGMCDVPGAAEGGGEALVLPWAANPLARLAQEQGWGALWGDLSALSQRDWAATPPPSPLPTLTIDDSGAPVQGGRRVREAYTPLWSRLRGWVALVELVVVRQAAAFHELPAGFSLFVLAAVQATVLMVTYYVMRPSVRCPFTLTGPGVPDGPGIMFDVCADVLQDWQ